MRERFVATFYRNNNDGEAVELPMGSYGEMTDGQTMQLRMLEALSISLASMAVSAERIADALEQRKAGGDA